MSYLLDTNVFIQAKNLHYGLDFCPAFWDWLIASNARGCVFSIDKVKDEIDEGEDELKDWVLGDGNNLFLKTDESTSDLFTKLSVWAQGKNYKQGAINDFFKAADFFLIAYALAHKHIVVTHETWEDSTKKIKIPNVCRELDLKCMSPYEMLRQEKARFILGGKQS